jgi:hypothetical protein
MEPHSLRFKQSLIIAATIATLLKLYLALKTYGSADVLGYEDYLIKIRTLGGIGSYYAGGAYGNPFNVPPLNIPVIRAMGWMADVTGLPFRFWLRLPCIVADLGSLALVWKLLELSGLKSKAALILLALCPASIMISGFHGNSDPVMIFFVLLSIYLLEKRQAVWLAGIAFGAAMSIKVVPLIFTPAFIFFLPTMRERARFVIVVGGLFLIGALPYILQNPVIIIQKVFGYGSFYGVWGWTRLLNLLLISPGDPSADSSHPSGWHAVLNTAGKIMMLAGISYASFVMSRKKPKVSLFIQCGVAAFLFMLLTPGFGVQYLSWPLPFVVCLGVWPTLIFYTTSGIYLFIDYYCWANRSIQPAYCYSVIPHYASFACWFSVIIVLMVYRRRVKHPDQAQSDFV